MGKKIDLTGHFLQDIVIKEVKQNSTRIRIELRFSSNASSQLVNFEVDDNPS